MTPRTPRTRPGTLNGVWNNNVKPAILCLHGGGTSAAIFNIQTIRIQRALAEEFDFVFLDGPFEGQAGPGVMPTFEGCGPYRRWTKLGIDGMPDETCTLIQDVMKEQEFVGVLGFSQGAKLTAGLLLEQQMEEKSQEQENGDVAKRPRFNFGVICMGVNPPLTLLPLGLVGAEIITVPTIHLIGQGDQWRDAGKKLFNEHFDHDQSKLFLFDVGHRLPTEEADTATIANEIRRLHRETSGGKQVDLGEVVE